MNWTMAAAWFVGPFLAVGVVVGTFCGLEWIERRFSHKAALWVALLLTAAIFGVFGGMR